jgi:hypothetical protein
MKKTGSYFLWIMLLVSLVIELFGISTPTNVAISIENEVLTLSWDQIAGDYFYKVFASHCPDNAFEEVTAQGEFFAAEQSIFWTSSLSDNRAFYQIIASDAYWTKSETIAGNLEHKFYHFQHHFLTIIDEDGTFNIRPHPGVDINGWGSSWYAQPFLVGATLKHTIIDSVIADSTGIHVQAHGFVSRDEDDTYGGWQANYSFTYFPVAKEIHGFGSYSITLPDTLSANTNDLNLYKIASNYMTDVPLLDGTIGATGDMDSVFVEADHPFFPLTWVPEDGAFFPQAYCDSLSVFVSGNYNIVDISGVMPAYKPSIKVVLVADNPGIELIFGAIYTEEEHQCFHCDNIGITPVILSDNSDLEFHYQVFFESKALPGDGN